MSESTSSPSSALLTRLLQFDVNPVWVKDLRQASRSWTVTGTLLLMLLVFYLISLGAVIFGEAPKMVLPIIWAPPSLERSDSPPLLPPTFLSPFTSAYEP